MICTSKNVNTPKKPTGAIALLDKYAMLNRGIEDAQNQFDGANSRLEKAENDIQNIKEERSEIVDLRASAESAIQHLKKQIRCTKIDRHKANDLRSEALNELANAKSDLYEARQYSKDSRSVFMQQCSNFRSDCKRMKVKSKHPRTPDTTGSDESDCFIDSYETFQEDEEGVCEKVSQRDSTSADLLIANSKSDNEIDITPGGKLVRDLLQERRGNKRKSSNNFDDEMREAAVNYKVNIAAKLISMQELKKIRAQHKSAMGRKKDRAHKLSQGFVQLERVRGDVENMENEMNQLERETKESTEMSKAFAKDADRRRKFQSTGSIHTNHSIDLNTKNQYTTTPSVTNSTRKANRSQVTPSPLPYTQSDSSRQTVSFASSGKVLQLEQYRASRVPNVDAKINNPYKAAPTPRLSLLTGSQDQHPHRAGRIRVNKQFSTALQIMSHSESTEHHNTYGNSRSTNEMNASYPKKIGAATSIQTKAPLEDTESDDELLSYVAFKKS